MQNYLGIILVVFTAISGILGAFFSKKGDREQISGVGWIIIVVTILLAAGTVWKYVDDEHEKTQKEAKSERSLQARDNEIASLSKKLQDANASIKNITSYTLLNFFDANRSASRIQIVFDANFSAAGERGPGPIDGPAKLSRSNETHQRVNFAVGDFGIFDLEYKCDNSANKCTPTSSESYKNFQKEGCKTERYKTSCDAYYVEDLGNSTSYGFMMPTENISPPRAFNSISKSTTVASFVYADQRDNMDAIKGLYGDFKKISIMIFQDYVGQAKKINDGCIKFATIDLKPNVYISGSDVVADLVHSNDYDLDVCFTL